MIISLRKFIADCLMLSKIVGIGSLVTFEFLSDVLPNDFLADASAFLKQINHGHDK